MIDVFLSLCFDFVFAFKLLAMQVSAVKVELIFSIFALAAFVTAAITFDLLIGLVELCLSSCYCSG